ncbi:pilus assembly protein PilM [candidate division CSSED10-310 bacterium]|uniref:Pilus assembly protein PilM n=1 Tax=candidate division CSSED10-310 bacterium TaxID=2855610 RepID=A0ABV6YZI5_UNCC1
MFLFEDSLGIDIRSDFLYATILGKSLSQYHLLDFLSEPLPGEGDPCRNEEIKTLLTKFIQQSGFGSGPILLGIPRKYALIRFLKLPLVPHTDINKLIKFEAERHLPGTIDDYFFDTHVIEEKIGTGMKILFVAIPQKIILEYYSLLKEIDLLPDVVDISGFSALNTLHFQHLLDGTDQTTAFLQLGFSETELMIMRAGKIYLTRTLPHHFPLQSEKDYELIEEEEVIDRCVEQFEFDVQNSLAISGLTTEGIVSIDSLVFPQGHQIHEKIAERLGVEMNVHASLFSSTAKLMLTKHDEQKLRHLDLTSAVGLTLRSYQVSHLTLNFLPTLMRRTRKKIGFLISMVLSGFIVLFLLFGLAVSFYKDNVVLEKINQHIESLQPEVENLNQLRENIKTSRDLVAELTELERRVTVNLDILSDLSTRIPESYWLNYLFLEKDRVTIHGHGDSPESLVNVLDTSLYLESVKLERVVDDRFTIEASLQEPSQEETKEKMNGLDEESDEAKETPETVAVDKKETTTETNNVADTTKKEPDNNSDDNQKNNEPNQGALKNKLETPPGNQSKKNEVVKPEEKMKVVERTMEKKIDDQKNEE